MITLENANADNVAYSIYSFYQVEDGYYDEMTDERTQRIILPWSRQRKRY